MKVGEPCERRYELDFDEGRKVAGCALRYGETTEFPWGVKERIEPGAFGSLANADVILTVMHDRDRPLARTGGGGLKLLDSAQELRIEAQLDDEDTDDKDTLLKVRRKVFRGLSVSFIPEKIRKGTHEGVSEQIKTALTERDQAQADASKAEEDRKAGETAAEDRADLLLLTLPLIPKDFDRSGKSDKDILVAAVGDEVEHASERSADYLRAKTAVAGVKDRKTNQVSAGVVARTDGPTLRTFVWERTSEGAQVYTDDASAYVGLPRPHQAVRHSVGRYVDGQAHTNGIESFWSMLKRGYHGTYHQMSQEHLQRYVNEFAGRSVSTWRPSGRRRDRARPCT